METRHCPSCNATTVLEGHLVSRGESGSVAFGFRPLGTRPTAWNPGVDLSSGFLTCSSCGLVWTSLAPEKLRAYVQDRGGGLAREHLQALEHGPSHDLPDCPEARQAGEGVAEIDALVLTMQRPAATRRYRELRAVTWDRAIDDVRGWEQRPRAEKLALFGWPTKESRPDRLGSRQAVKWVAEIDALVLAMQQPAATRRYRELLGVTWDRAIDVIRGWDQHSQAEKLALFGGHLKDTLPDCPEARQAGELVEELDALVLGLQQPAAIRLYRESLGVTWDQAIDAIRGWDQRSQAEKLALFGWRPKDSLPADKPVRAGHPMHDPLLDGS